MFEGTVATCLRWVGSSLWGF